MSETLSEKWERVRKEYHQVSQEIRLSKMEELISVIKEKYVGKCFANEGATDGLKVISMHGNEDDVLVLTACAYGGEYPAYGITKCIDSRIAHTIEIKGMKEIPETLFENLIYRARKGMS